MRPWWWRGYLFLKRLYYLPDTLRHLYYQRKFWAVARRQAQVQRRLEWLAKQTRNPKD